MKRSVATIVAVLGMLSYVGSAWAQDEEKMRQESLKEKLQYLQDKTKGLPEPGPAAKPFVATTFDNGIKFKSEDGKFEGALGGRIYFVARAYIGDRNELAAPLHSTFAIDTARVTFDGTYNKQVAMRIETEAKHGSAFALKEAWMTYKGDGWNLQAGQFKMPFSQEETCSSRFIDFAERSIVNRFVPSRDTGLMFDTSFMEKTVTVEFGAFNGNGVNANDNNDEKDIALRVRYFPMPGLRVGIAATGGDQDNTAITDVTSGDLGGFNIIDFNAGFFDGLRRRVGFEFSYLTGGIAVRGEYFSVSQLGENGAGTTAQRFEVKCFYVQVSYLLTGEEKTLENRIKPAKNFDPSKGEYGAWELALRIASVDASDAEDFLINTGTLGNRKTQEVTLGVNWIWNPQTRVCINVCTFTLEDPIVTTHGNMDDLKMLYVSWQINF